MAIRLRLALFKPDCKTETDPDDSEMVQPGELAYAAPDAHRLTKMAAVRKDLMLLAPVLQR